VAYRNNGAERRLAQRIPFLRGHRWTATTIEALGELRDVLVRASVLIRALLAEATDPHLRQWLPATRPARTNQPIQCHFHCASVSFFAFVERLARIYVLAQRRTLNAVAIAYFARQDGEPESSWQ